MAAERACEECGASLEGRRPHARACSVRCYNAAYWKANKTTLRTRARAWRDANPDHVREYRNQYEAENRERMLENRRAWKRANPERNRLAQARRLARQQEAPGDGVSAADWAVILNWADNRCAYCATELTEVHLEHVVPLSRGGAHDVRNVVPACPPCNWSKHDKTAEEWMPGWDPPWWIMPIEEVA